MQAVILAGGKGTRLAPYTTVFPKPLMPVGEVPILEMIIRQLKASGFDRIEMATGYLSGLIEAYFGNGSRWDIQINYHIEETSAGTAGPLRLMRDILDDTFLIMNGDVMTDLDYYALMKAHQKSEALLTVATCQRDITLPLGAIIRVPDGRISDYVEKPTYHFECSAGIYAGSKEIVSFIEGGHPVDLPDLVKILIAQGKKLEPFPITGFWLDIGTPEDYRLANEQFAARFSHLIP